MAGIVGATCGSSRRAGRFGLVGLLLAIAGCGDLFPPAAPLSSLQLEFNSAAAATAVAAPGGSPVFRRRAVFLAIEGRSGSHAATVAAMPDGELLAAWYSYVGPHELTGSAIYMARMAAGGDSWSEPLVHADRPEGDGNPVLYAEGERVWFFQAVVPALWSTAHLETQVSEDEGRTWSSPEAMGGPLGANVRYPPVRTARGLLLPAYDDLLSRNLFYLSEDGHRWSVLNAVPTVPATIQASVVTLPGGRLLAALRNREFGDLLVIASDDQGDSWSSPTGSGFPSPDSGAALCRLASGNLLLVYNDSPSDRVRLTAALSADEGLSWPCRCRLTGEEEVCSYPAAAQAPDGLVHIVFSVGRERIDHIACNEAWLTSPEAQVP